MVFPARNSQRKAPSSAYFCASIDKILHLLHKEKGDLKNEAERISGFSKKDRILPVIALCVCFDKEKWDAPRSLYDMFDKIDPEIQHYVNDYKLNLITPDEIEDFVRFSSERGLVFSLANVKHFFLRWYGKHFFPSGVRSFFYQR